MEKAVNGFPFHKLKFYTYLTLEVMMNVERSQVLNFMFSTNKEARAFL